ncbi:MAG: transcription initiation protein [Microlunatus sp.]|nr:transcription initiation protein [Microlunatus sp.]
MKFLFLVCAAQGRPTPTPADGGTVVGTLDPVSDDVQVWVDEYDAGSPDGAGHRVTGDPLDGHTETVRVRDGEVLVTDGPFLESKEYIAGFDLIEAPSLEVARTIAAKHPMAHHTGIEIRPLIELD